MLAINKGDLQGFLDFDAAFFIHKKAYKNPAKISAG